MRRIFSLLLILSFQFGWASELCRNSFTPSQYLPWFAKKSFASIEQGLANGKIVKMVPLQQGLVDEGKAPGGKTKNTALVYFEDGSMAIWKPGNWAPPGEVAAYKAAQEVGFELVPPTVERIVDGTRGSLQYFVRTPFDLANMGGKQLKSILANVPDKQKSDRDIFNFVFGQWDVHSGNVLIDEMFNIVSIDNGGIRDRLKVQIGEIPFIRKLVLTPGAIKNLNLTAGPFPYDRATFLERPTVQQLENFLKPYAFKESLEQFLEWRKPTKDRPDPDNSMKIVFWDDAIWIQGTGYMKYTAIPKPAVFFESTLQAYRQLTFERLRQIFPKEFLDKQLYEILERRDQILSAAAKDAKDKAP
jgi:hypothetical protein